MRKLFREANEIVKKADAEKRAALPHGTHGDTAEDEGSMMELVDSEEQRLWVRVGPVYYPRNGKEIPQGHKEPGIWIDYFNSPKNPGKCKRNDHGPFLMSEAQFEAMVKHVRRKFKQGAWWLKQRRRRG